MSFPTLSEFLQLILNDYSSQVVKSNLRLRLRKTRTHQLCMQNVSFEIDGRNCSEKEGAFDKVIGYTGTFLSPVTRTHFGAVNVRTHPQLTSVLSLVLDLYLWDYWSVLFLDLDYDQDFIWSDQ